MGLSVWTRRRFASRAIRAVMTLLALRPVASSAARVRLFSVHPKVDQPGIDLLRFGDSKIVEVWLFSSNPEQEDAFWG